MPQTVRVVINEIAWAGTVSDANDEWIELYNASDSGVDLAGWTLKSDDGSPSIALSGVIAPGGFYLLERTADDTISDISADTVYTGALVDGGEVLVLRDSQGIEQDRVDAWHAGDRPSRISMERIDPLGAGSDPSNWATNDGSVVVGADAGGNPIRGTPAHANSVVAATP